MKKIKIGRKYQYTDTHTKLLESEKLLSVQKTQSCFSQGLLN
jgi:hypothetical protein